MITDKRVRQYKRRRTKVAKEVIQNEIDCAEGCIEQCKHHLKHHPDKFWRKEMSYYQNRRNKFYKMLHRAIPRQQLRKERLTQ